MSTQIESRLLPVGVVSTDAIEQLDPFVPPEIFGDTSSDHSCGESGSRPSGEPPQPLVGPVTREVPGSSSFQLISTAIPLVLCDGIVLSYSMLMAGFAAALVWGSQIPTTFVHQWVAVVAGYFLFGMLQGLFPGSGTSPVVELRQTVLAVWASFCLMVVLNLAFGVLAQLELLLAAFGVLLATGLVPLGRLVIRKLLARTNWWGERAIIVGAGPQGRALFRFYDRAIERGLRPIGLVDAATAAEYQSDGDPMGVPYLGSITDLDRLNRRYQARWAIVAPGGCEQLDMGQVIANANKIPNLLILPSQFLLPSLWATTRECAGVMGVHLRDHLRNPLAMGLKRGIDIGLSIAAMVILTPLFTLVIAWVKLKSPGSAFYSHKRIGRGGKVFKAWKFRSMVSNADDVLEECLEQNPEMRLQWIEGQKLKDDPRIIRGIGQFIRKTSLDELPQLWNVIKGDMSLVGPRPIVNEEISRYREMYPLYLRVRPGITGLWQVSGRNDTSYEQRVRLDSYYVCNWSIWLDAYLVLRTIRTILLREGAY